MNLFDELCADAKKDIESGVFLQQENSGNVDTDVSKAVEDMEKKINETLNKAVEKVNNAVGAAAANNNNNVPKVTESNNDPDTNTNTDSEVN